MFKTIISILATSALMASLATISINHSKYEAHKANMKKEAKCAFDMGRGGVPVSMIKTEETWCAFYANNNTSRYGMAY